MKQQFKIFFFSDETKFLWFSYKWIFFDWWMITFVFFNTANFRFDWVIKLISYWGQLIIYNNITHPFVERTLFFYRLFGPVIYLGGGLFHFCLLVKFSQLIALYESTQYSAHPLLLINHQSCQRMDIFPQRDRADNKLGAFFLVPYARGIFLLLYGTKLEFNQILQLSQFYLFWLLSSSSNDEWISSRGLPSNPKETQVNFDCWMEVNFHTKRQSK